MSDRELFDIYQGRATSDGAGVKLLRVFGGGRIERFDPFLMLDEFGSENPDDYIAGFPPHPHRGFETITYMLQGRMRHEDHLGHVGLLETGGMQWMTAGRGIIHSEMPERCEGRMRGLQIWLNLPAQDKLCEPGYRDYGAAELPRLELDGARVTVLAGEFRQGDTRLAGPLQRPTTAPQLLGIELAPGARIAPEIPDGHRVLVYVLDGSLRLGAGNELIAAGQVVRLGLEGEVRLASDAGANLLLMAGRPLEEPIEQYGPFVMNTREQIEQALADYRDGRLA